jgi:hypothetical protein
MNSTLDNNLDSISIMPFLKGHEMPGDVHDFMSKLSISDDAFLKIIKDCMQYLEHRGLIPTELSIRHVKDLEEPEHEYFRVLFVLPLLTIADAIKLQAQFYTDVYRDIINARLGKNHVVMDGFRRRVNIVFDVEYV